MGSRSSHLGTNIAVMIESEMTRNASRRAMLLSAARAGVSQVNGKPNPHLVMARSAT